ncbi:MAG: hypothetical protein PWR03_1762 [Tenuifilum sp.]|jgi:hypothetical protein|uniref:acyl-CoA reductase n=1 Tax=Tenuifilum sp. TaxID=2760880 RepID=UPI0024ABEDBA|nr:acyl-CoA reductase [Tenuifilum sp.]MDI3527579.1 hypothetical protein [Tenuifilum sp.]
MNIEKRINAFVNLGLKISESVTNASSLLGHSVYNAQFINPWFTPSNIINAANAITQKWLKRDALAEWVKKYPIQYFNPKKVYEVGVIMAGNIPLVGFHDFLCVLITGNRINIKLSSKDGGLTESIAKMLLEVEPEFKDFIKISDGTLKDFDAVIATGSDSSAKYFDYYFRNYPSLIRGHRNSVAVLSGNESDEELALLSNDIFSYFGLGCRNVSKLLVPVGYNFERLINSMEKWTNLINHHRYANNYEYNRTILIMNQEQHLDTGFSLLVPNESIDAQVSVINYQEYNSIDAVTDYLALNDSKIQCVVSNIPIYHSRLVNFGEAQRPLLTDYSDGIDTIEFLGKLNQ